MKKPLPIKRILVFLALSLIGSILTICAYFLGWMITKEHFIYLPVYLALGPFILIFGIPLGIILTPYLFWCLRDKNLHKVIPILYTGAVFFTVLSTYTEKVDVIIAFDFVYWGLALLMVKKYWPDVVR